MTIICESDFKRWFEDWIISEMPWKILLENGCFTINDIENFCLYAWIASAKNNEKKCLNRDVCEYYKKASLFEEVINDECYE